MRELPRHHGSISPKVIQALVMPATKPVVLEIGCNDGTDSLNLLTIPGVELHCFECDPRPIARFKAKMHTAGQPDKKVLLHEYALSREDGTAEFHQSGGTTQGAHLPDWDLSGSLRKPLGHLERHKWCRFDNKIQVETRKLDTWLEFFPNERIDFIWLDVQGAEADVIAGGPRTLARTRFVYAEFNDFKKPLYEGDLTLEQTVAALGPAWEAVALYEGYNVLVRNKEFDGAAV